MKPGTVLRARWRGRPGPVLRILGATYGLGVDVRNLLYEAGLLAPRPAPIGVLSVGGLTAGGSGKTPIAAEVARWLRDDGKRTVLITAGLADEVALLREALPGLPVLGGRRRLALLRQAARAGAEVAVLDSGFQHRRLRRDLEILCVDSVSAGLRPVRRLPAGPFRERWTELRRADAIIIVRRPEATPAPARLLSEVRRQAPWARIGCCVLRPGELVPLNAAALERTPHEVVAVAGVMWPGPFFAQLRARGLRLLSAQPFRDHEPYRDRTLRRLERLASGHGIVCTPKDGVKLRSRLADNVPLWTLEERLVWEAGEGRIRACALRAARIGAPRAKGRAHAEAPEAA